MSRIVTIQEVKDRIKEIHGDSVSLVESTYVNTQTSATFIDKEFGAWQAKPNNILRGMTHRDRSVRNSRMSVDEIMKRIGEIHGDIISLDVSTYKNTHTKSKFIDKDYGPWMAKANWLLNGQGHKKRGLASTSNVLKLPIEKLKIKLKDIFEDLVCIDESTYVSSHIKAKFIDKEYGEWWTIPSNLLSRKTSHPKRANLVISSKLRCSLQEVIQRIFDMYGDEVKIVEHTYTKLSGNAIFIDKQYGAWKSTPKNVLKGHLHPIKGRLNGAKSKDVITEKIHWKTKEIIYCQASWEAMVVDYFNVNKINFIWQPKSFEIPLNLLQTKRGTNRKYHPDCYLPEQDLWIEIKGRFYELGKIKWDWFHKSHPNSELWDREKLHSMGIMVK